MSLAGKNILVTRPCGQVDALLDNLRAAGADAWHYPVLEIAALEQPDELQRAKQLLLDLDLYQQLIFISSNAVRFGVEAIEDYWPQLPMAIEWRAIGAATQAAMQRAGLPLAESGAAEVDMNNVAMNSEALLQQGGLRDVAGQKILIVRGVGGREYLAEQLRARGAVVDYLECYRRRLPELPADELAGELVVSPADAICVNSGESLENLCLLLASALALRLSTPLLVPGERVATLARERGFSTVIVADNAGAEASQRALQQFFT